MKIHIIGGSGTVKTYLANLLSAKYNVPHYDLDDLFWDNSANQYGIKMPENKRNEMLNRILRNEDWIIEGVYYSWLADSFEKADTIIVLDIPKKIYKYRIIRRFIKRKIGIEHGKKETLKSVKSLLKWTDKFQKENLPQIRTVLNNYANKTILLHSKREVNNFAK